MMNLNPNQTNKRSATDNYFSSLPNEHEHKIKMREMYSRVAHDMGMFHYPLHIAIKQDFIQLVQFILNYKQLFNMKIEETYTKRTALHVAAGKCSTEIISLLLEEGQVEEDQLDLNGHTPLDIVWKLLSNLDYEFEYREETLK
ncbi:unnamed protein product [Rotaria sordida]|uniref:Ankyrin repeat protein n=1 Tax=Rotaria sordida TaxID=392033 RepID=A0A819ST18_9BILA|nr:unnamed protein product [Rotaria sordida]